MRVPTYGGQKVSTNALPSVYQNAQATPEDFGAGQGKALAQFGATLGDAWDKKLQADGEAQALAAISQADLDNTQRFVDLQSKVAPGADGFSEAYLKDHDDYYKEILAKTDNPYAKKKLEEHALQSREAYGKQAIIYQAKEGVRNRSELLLTAADNEAKMMLDMNGPDAERFLEQSIQRGDAAIDAQPLPPDQKAELKAEARSRRAEAAWMSKLKNPDELLKPQSFPGGFDNAMDVVEKNEGGFTAIDGSSGAPAIYGVNRKWHPEAFDEAKKLTDEKGEAAGKAYAREFYKKEFWDKNGIGNLPKESQLVVMDGVVNHSSSFGQKLVEAAKNGASPDELSQMRRGEYQRLAKANPEKYGNDLKGWMSRMDRIEGSSMLGTVGKYMTADQQARAVGQAYKLIERDYELSKKDPAAWGKKKGYDLDTIVGMQGNPFYASVLGNDEAKELALKVSQSQTPDEIMNLAGSLKEQYGRYSDNAIRDMKAAGLKPAHEAALVLANQGSYGEQVELLAELGSAGDTVANAQFKDVGYDDKQLEEVVQSEMEAWLPIMQREGLDIGTSSANYQVVKQLAKARMLKKMDGDYEEAVKFALAPQNERYKLAELNGVEYRIPTRDPDGGVYDVEALQERIENAYLDMRPAIADANAKKGFHLNDDVIPYLNESQDGVEFVSAIGQPILDKNGNRFSLKFDDVVSGESKQERIKRIRKEMEALPFGEREAFRKKEFNLK